MCKPSTERRKSIGESQIAVRAFRFEVFTRLWWQGLVVIEFRRAPTNRLGMGPNHRTKHPQSTSRSGRRSFRRRVAFDHDFFRAGRCSCARFGLNARLIDTRNGVPARSACGPSPRLIPPVASSPRFGPASKESFNLSSTMPARCSPPPNTMPARARCGRLSRRLVFSCVRRLKWEGTACGVS